MTWNGTRHFFERMLKGFGLLIRDFHRFLHGRFGDRVNAAYAIAGLIFFLVITGGMWKIIEALIPLVVVVVIIVFAVKMLFSPVRRGR